MNELTFAAKLGTITRLWYEEKLQRGDSPVIARGEIEEKQVDSPGAVRRCDLRFNRPKACVGGAQAARTKKRVATREARIFGRMRSEGVPVSESK